MSSKRQRGESSRSSKPYDKKKFVSEAAAERYNTVLGGKTLVPERGLRPHETQDGKIAAMITDRSWFEFTKQPEPAAISVVKEFYANAKEAVHYEVQVRGRTVSYDRSSINSYYNLPNIDYDGYTVYAQEQLDLDKVIKALCRRPDTNWKSKDNGYEAISFSHTELSRYGKAWYSFICAKMMPTRHMSDVTKERAVLLYSIVKGKTIDVGQVIQSSITHNLKGSTSGGLPHPSLIYGLCKRANVVFSADEILQSPMALIDHAMIARYKVWEGGISHPRGAGFIIAPTSLAAKGPSESQQQASTSVPPRDLADEVRGLRQESRRQSRRIDQVAQRIDCVAQRLDSFMAYNTDFNTALVQMFANCGFNAGPSPVQFPEPPMFPAYPPDLADEEDDSDD